PPASAPDADARRYLQRLLARKFGSLKADICRTEGGATLVRCPSAAASGESAAAACSFFPAKARHEVLLEVLWRRSYRDLASRDIGARGAVPLDSFATPAELRAVIGRFSDTRVLVRAARLWGRSVWSGQLIGRGEKS
ncbi:MAG: hypothetical protein AAF725_23725, partial [Acidobacteriota bacterium]